MNVWRTFIQEETFRFRFVRQLGLQAETHVTGNCFSLSTPGLRIVEISGTSQPSQPPRCQFEKISRTAVAQSPGSITWLHIARDQSIHFWFPRPFSSANSHTDVVQVALKCNNIGMPNQFQSDTTTSIIYNMQMRNMFVWGCACVAISVWLVSQQN